MMIFTYRTFYFLVVRFRERKRLVSVLLSGDGIFEAGDVELEGRQPVLQPRPPVLKLPDLQSTSTMDSIEHFDCSSIGW